MISELPQPGLQNSQEKERSSSEEYSKIAQIAKDFLEGHAEKNAYDKQNEFITPPKLTLSISRKRKRDASPTIQTEPLSKFTSSFSLENLRANLKVDIEEARKKKDRYLKSIQQNSNFALSYLGLGMTLPLEDFHEGMMSSQALFLKAIDLAPRLAKAYLYLGLTVSDIGHIQLLNGRKMTQEEVFQKAIELDPKLEALFNASFG